MAEKRDMENFNQHSQGKSKLKYEMRSYQEMAVNQMKQMSEDNQQLTLLKNQVVKEQRSKKALEESFGLVTAKLRETMVENQVVKLKTKKHHEQNKEEMDSQEQFYKEHIQQLYDAGNEEKFEKIKQHEREKVTQSEENVSCAEGRTGRGEEIARFIQLQDREMEEFVIMRNKLVEAHEERRFDEEFNKLMEEYTPTESKQHDKAKQGTDF